MVETKIQAVMALREHGWNGRLIDARDLVEEIMKLGVKDFLIELAIFRSLTAFSEALAADGSPSCVSTQVGKLINNLMTDIMIKLNKEKK